MPIQKSSAVHKNASLTHHKTTSRHSSRRQPAAAEGVPHGAFLLTLALFVAPLVAMHCCGKASSSHERSHRDTCERDCSAKGLAFWLLLVRGALRDPVRPRYRGTMEAREKTMARHKEDLLRQSLLCGRDTERRSSAGRLGRDRPSAYVVAFTIGYCGDPQAAWLATSSSRPIASGTSMRSRWPLRRVARRLRLRVTIFQNRVHRARLIVNRRR